MEREKLIRAEKNKLKKYFAALPKEKKDIVDGLIQNAAFMKITLQELQQDVVENGAMINYISGNGFESVRDNPAQKAYTTMISRYSAVMSQLLGLLPNDTVVADEFEEFIK